MLSIELIRSETNKVRNALERKGENPPLDFILSLDADRRSNLAELEAIRSNRNQISKELGRMAERPEQKIIEVREIGQRIKVLEERVREIETDLSDELLKLPNLPLEDVPSGEDESSNVVLETFGNARNFDFVPLPHWTLGEDLGIIDLPRGSKISGSRFYSLIGEGAKLQRSIYSWMLDLHSREHGYTEVYLPYMVRKDVMVGSGNLPKFSDNLYHDAEDDLWLIPTAEVPLTGLHKDEIIDESDLPIYYVAHTPSFRREKAAAGRDTRGIKRVHQFDKVELYKLVTPKSSDEELGKLLTDAMDVCRLLDIPYRVVQLCSGDMGFPSAKSFDLEMWSPGCEEWLEVSSCSNCTDFQARRSNIRFRGHKGSRPEFLHTLNGSGLALPRVMIAIMENYQTASGSIEIPEVLRPYMGQNIISS